MKSDIDALMKAKGLDAILILGNAQHNPPMYYLTGGGHISDATLIKKYQEQAILFHQDMERGEAEKTGLKCISYSKYPQQELLNEAQGDTALMSALRLQRILNDHGIKGRIGLYGHTDASAVYAALSHLQKLTPHIEILGETREDSIFMLAMETKDENELARIRKMGMITTTVVSKVADFLTTRQVRSDEVLMDEGNKALTIADVKNKINLWLAELGADNPKGTIFSLGRDSGLPHSVGNPDDLISLGKTIVFDIFPCENGGGYFYDFTRTWCLGYAPKETVELHRQVKTVYDLVMNNFMINLPFKELNLITCQEFEKLGHQSPLNTQAPIEGYVHSVGHGLGLNVHERPWSGITAAADNILKPGVVVTVEPGLYYPEKNMGVRIEDSVCIKQDGKIEILAEYPHDLLLEMKS